MKKTYKFTITKADIQSTNESELHAEYQRIRSCPLARKISSILPEYKDINVDYETVGDGSHKDIGKIDPPFYFKTMQQLFRGEIESFKSTLKLK